MENTVSGKLDKIETTVSKGHQALHELLSTLFEVQRLTSALRDKLRPKFLESSPTKRTFGEQVKGICDDILVRGSKRVLICITGYFDNEIVDRLEKILSVGGEVKIIVPKLEREGTNILRKMTENYGVKVKIHPLLHARIFYVHRDGQPWGVIIGSGDLTNCCLSGKRFDAAIWSNHPDITKSAVDFFNRAWQDKEAQEI